MNMSVPENIPIAIVGIGCRLPGGAHSPHKLWELLKAGTNAWTHVPPDRYNESAFHNSNPDDANGTHNHPGGHFITEDIRHFDNDFFNISTQEAAAMDPQQRILLESVYEAFESAGQLQNKVQGSQTSVHVALFTRDYDRNMFKDTMDIPRHQIIGTGDAIAANRISHAFDLKGPSVTLDTGCSGSLVAVHQACNTLRLGECDMAIAAAANLIISPDHQIGMSNMHMLNEHGRSYPFDSRGSGYGRGEGVASLVLKRLDTAIKEGDPIRAVILGSAVNSDGRTISGITYPSGTAQAALQKGLYCQLNIEPSSISYVEAHGTGTVAGDREEISGLAEVFCQDRTTPLYVGSIKSNIGHLEATSGLAGLIKTVISLEHRQIPPNADFRTAKDNLHLAERGILIPTTTTTWPQSASVRAAVNSFGYGGTNAHVVLGSAPEADVLGPVTTEDAPRIFTLSAKDDRSLSRAVENIKHWLQDQVEDICLASLSHTLNDRRTQYACRFACVANGHKSLIDQIAQSSLSPRSSPDRPNSSLNFVFTGQGAQWPGMGRELLLSERSSAFTDSMYRSRDILCILGADWDLVEEILRDGETSLIHEAAKSQPATSAVQIALVDLLASMGVHPAATLGHSSGEIVAAYAAGYISQSTALRIAYSRGLVSSLDRKPGLSKGAMLSVALSETDAMEQIKKLGKGIVVVACVNSGQNTTVSGDEEAIDELAARLSMLDIFNRKLRVDNAYHSHHMQAVAIDYKQLMGVVTSETPTSPVRFFSTVNATAKSENFNADYWCNNLTSQVRFKEALEKICHAQDGCRQVFLEIGPHNALAGPIRQVLTGMQNPVEYDYISILRRGVDATQSSLEVIGKLFVLGQQVDLSVAGRLDPQHENAKTLHSLPGYSWNHSKGHWHESRLSKDHRLRKHPYHDLLGVKCLGITSFDLSWRHMISVASLPWLIDHVVDGMVVFPGSGYLCMAIEAVSQLAKDTFPGESRLRITLKDVEFLKALLVPPTPQRTEVQISLSTIPLPFHSTTKLHHRFRVTGFGNDDVWDEHCRGYIQVDFDDNVVEASIVSDLSLRNGACLERPYQQLRENGNNYGPTFTGISEMAISDKHAIATVKIPHVVDVMPTRYMQPHIIHPTSLDIVMHTSLPLVARRFGPGTIIPIHIDKLIISSNINHKPGAILSVHAQLDDLRARTAEVDIEAFNDGNSSPSLSLSGLKLRTFNARSPVKEARSSSLSAYWNLCWDLDVDCLAAQHLLADQVGSSDHSSWKEKLRILNTASVGYIRRCLQFIDVQGLRVKSEYKPLVDWMRRLSNSRGSNGHCPEQKQDSYYSATDETNFAEMKIVARTGPQLPMIVSGEVDALQLVLEDNLLYTAYQDHSSMLCYKLLRQYAKHLVFKKSSLRILEIGGGTGSATLPFLRAMKAAGFTPSVYDFTDVSTGFFERAAEKLADFPVQYRKLDIEEDPAQQGFEPQTYDVVLAFNCLHVTSSIETTLRHARSLLKPDGRLILIEIVNPQPYHHISFGTLPGYWKGGIDGRPDGPFMSETRWRETLSAIGMNLSLSKKDNESAHISSLMVAHSHESLARPVETALQIVSVGSAFESVKSKMLAALLDQGLPTVVKTIDEGLNEDPAVKIIFDDGEHPLLSNVSSDMFRRLCALLNTQTRIMWISISRDQTSIMTARKQLITGLARSAHAENDNLQFVTVDVQQKFDDTDPYMSDLLLACLYRSFLVPNTNAEREYVIRNDAVQIPRLLPCDALNEAMAETQQTLPTKQQSFASHPSILLRGNTRSLEEPIFELDEAKFAENQIELQVQAVGVPISDTTTPFYEYSGTIVKLGSSVTSLQVGDRVMAIGTSPYANRPYVFAFDAHRIPNHMTSITAAALPLALITAYYTLFELMETGSSQTIMLHGARTITHRVILRVAQRKGINLVVFEPESAEASRLQKLFHVPASHIIHSAGKRRRREQQHEVKEVDMIITSELCDMPSQLLALLNPFGKIVSLQGSDTVKVDINSHLHLPPNVTLHMCDMHAFWRAKPREAALLLSQAVALTMSTEESFSAIPIIVKPIDDIKEVIKEDESSRSLSKIVLEVRDDSVVSVVRPSTSDFKLDSHATFVIAGGLGDLGQRLLLLMAKHGAKHIVALSRRAPDEHVSKRLAANIPDGCQIHHIRCDVACEDDVRVTIVTIASKGLPPVKGVIQSAMKLQDRTLNNMTHDDFTVPLATKMTGTLNLDRAFSSPNHHLDFFITLSSVANIVGTRGQANYNAGNAVQDAIPHIMANTSGCHYLTLNVGMVRGTDAVDTHDERNKWLHRSGLKTIDEAQLSGVFEYILSPQARDDRMRQIVMGFDASSLAANESMNGNVRAPMFAHVLGTTEVSVKQAAVTKTRTFKEVRETEGAHDILAFAIAALCAKLSSLLSIDAAAINVNKALVEFGIDSLVAIELRNWIKREFGTAVQSLEILNEGSIKLLAKKIVDRAG